VLGHFFIHSKRWIYFPHRVNILIDQLFGVSEHEHLAGET
jgi:hypothetical protein